MNRHILFFVLAAVGAFPACKDETNVPATPDQNQILPLATGNTWEFLRSWIDSNGVPVYSSSLLVSVGQPDTFGTEKAYPVANFPFVFVSPEPLLCSNRPGGLYIAIPAPDSLSAAFARLLTFPTNLGDSITFSQHTIRTASVNEHVVVPGGSFTCVRYDIFQSDTLRGKLFVAPNIGIVRVWQRYYAVSALVDEMRSFRLH